MYIGSTDERGLNHLVLEAADRALDEVLAGRASRVEVTLLPDGGIRIADDGPGAMLEPSDSVGDPGLRALLTRFFMTSSRSLPGVGLVVVNALSSRLVAEMRREGIRQVREYVRGTEVTPPADERSTDSSGTSVTFWPDADIFQTTEFSFDVLAARFRELAFLNRGADISVTDERPAEPRSDRFRFPGGVRDMVAFLDESSSELVDTGREIIGFELEEPRMAGTMDVAWRWRDAGPELIRTYANSVPTLDGGTHLLGFRDGVAAAATAYAREHGLLEPAEPDLDTDPVSEGLTAVVSVRLERPEYEGCTLGKLGSPAVRGHVRQSVQKELGEWLRKHPEQAADLVGRMIRRARRA
ncbi:MAG TPA: ATP-binding protein [Actinospica sp.]|nr:ATP-binding protein [Actinospica sp.]